MTFTRSKMASLCRRLLTSSAKFSHIAARVGQNNASASNQMKNILVKNNVRRDFSVSTHLSKKETVTLYFITQDNEKMKAKAKVGDNLLDVIIDNDLDIDGFGACEGTLACSTCHLIFTPAQFDTIPEQATDEELDMLDLAYQLEDTSRLGCQVLVRPDMEGWEIKVPAGVADARDV